MPLLDGIVGCWSPSVRGSGYLLPDLSGRGNHGTLTNMDAGTDWPGAAVRGVHGRVLDYDGVNDRLNCGQSGGNLTETLPFSVTAWAIARTVGANRGLISRDQTSPFPFSIRFDGDARLGILTDGAAIIGPTITTNQWFFYCATFATNRRIIYLNGTSRVDSGTGYTISANNDQLSIGSDFVPASDRCWDGQIGEIAIFQRALTASEIMDIYRSGNGAIGRQLTGQTRRRVYGFVPAATGARRRRIICGGNC